MTEEDKLMELVKINAEVGWKCNFRCEDCYRFFDCPSPYKYEFYRSPRMEKIRQNLAGTQHIIAVMSGKGGVGKSTVSANLAVALAQRGYSTAIIDSDFCGPSIPGILGLDTARLKSGPGGIVPPLGPLGIKVVSTAFLLETGEAITWLHELKRGALELFLANTDYGYLDYLIIDLPPGTGSETVNLFKYLNKVISAVIITAPSDLTEQVVRRCISLCQSAKIPILGLIENLSSFTCPTCDHTFLPEHVATDLMAMDEEISVLGRIPRDPVIVSASNKGKSFVMEYPKSHASQNFHSIVDGIEAQVGGKGQNNVRDSIKQGTEKEKAVQLMEIMEINVDYSCYGKICSTCSRYFRCTLPNKIQLSEDMYYQKITERMKGIKHKIAVMSCKGGVGKSTFAVNLAASLASQGMKTCILDCDFHGPSVPRILGMEDVSLKIGRNGIVPAVGPFNLGIMSIAFTLQQGESVNWFDALKKVTVEQLLSYVDYRELDYLVVDLPPGTGAESCGLIQCLPELDGTLIITIPSRGPQTVVRRSIGLCREAHVPIIGIVENMSGFVCPHCGQVAKFPGAGSGRYLAHQTGVPYLGKIPIDHSITESCNRGVPFVLSYPQSPVAQAFQQILKRVKKSVESSPRKPGPGFPQVDSEE